MCSINNVPASINELLCHDNLIVICWTTHYTFYLKLYPLLQLSGWHLGSGKPAYLTAIDAFIDKILIADILLSLVN
jgi:hypothetical protein